MRGIERLKVKLTLFIYMRGDAALRGRVDSEYASIRTAFDVPIHSAGAFIDGLLEDFGFPAVQERGIKPSSGIAAGEDEGLLRIQSLSREGVELCGVPVNLNSNLWKEDGIGRICAFSVGCEDDVGLVVMGIKILRKDR